MGQDRVLRCTLYCDRDPCPSLCWKINSPANLPSFTLVHFFFLPLFSSLFSLFELGFSTCGQMIYVLFTWVVCAFLFFFLLSLSLFLSFFSFDECGLKKHSAAHRQERASGCALAENVIQKHNYPNKTPAFPACRGFALLSASSCSFLTITQQACVLFSDFPDFLAGKWQTLSGFNMTSLTGSVCSWRLYLY